MNCRGSANPLTLKTAEWARPSLPRRAALTAAALGSSCGEEACGLFGELFRKLEVRAVPGIRVEDQPGIR